MSCIIELDEIRELTTGLAAGLINFGGRFRLEHAIRCVI